MAELLQEEKQKVTFPEIRDTADSYAEEYTDGYTDELTEAGQAAVGSAQTAAGTEEETGGIQLKFGE